MKIAPYLFKRVLVYGSLSAGFSLVGLLLPFSSAPGNPLASVSVEHVMGHIAFGAMAGFTTFKFRYIIASGLFAIILDADHLVNFIGIDIVSRMGHSIPFALLAPIMMVLVFGKKDYLLGVISFAAVFSHLAFDTLQNAGSFPIFAPFTNYTTSFQGMDWVYLQLVAVFSVVIIKYATKNKPKLS